MNAEFVVRPYGVDDWGAVCGIYDLAKPDEMHGIVAAVSVLAARALYTGLGFVVEREFDGDFNGKVCPALRLTFARNQGALKVGPCDCW